MEKIGKEFILRSYKNGLATYRAAAESLGLWASEKYVVEKYFSKNDHILDLGCGAGRTTLGMYHLGYSHLRGVDLHPEMVAAARQLGPEIPYQQGDATQLEFEAGTFDAVLFSFNGIMSIPGRANRRMAFEEINRVLKPEGIFIFTTHDREEETRFLELWRQEEQKWAQGQEDPRLYDFGDLITYSADVKREIYIHIPNRAEVGKMLQSSGFSLVETFYRPEKFVESEAVRKFSNNCRFWITRKPETKTLSS